MKLIKRNEYLQKIVNVIGTPDIKVITGVRRSGKSKLLEAFRDYVIENIPNANVIHINFNLAKFEGIYRQVPGCGCPDYHRSEQAAFSAFKPG